MPRCSCSPSLTFITWGFWIILSSINIACVCLVALTVKVRAALGEANFLRALKTTKTD
jgi:hypothetical protein